MIDANSILQVDGTVIAGILILLTIKSFKKDGSELPTKIKLTPKQACGYVIVPFSISAAFMIFGSLVTTFDMTGFQLASISTIIGFVYLIVVIIAINEMTKNDTQFLK